MGMEALKRQKWIPCSERLPENGERVLAYCKDRVIHDVKWSWPQNAWFDKVTGHEYFESFVTHWMPLPESLVEGENKNAE